MSEVMTPIRCLECRGEVRHPWRRFRFRSHYFCSGRCNNQTMNKLRYQKYEPWIRYHSQKLGFLHKRGWLTIGSRCFGYSYNLCCKFLHFEISKNNYGIEQYTLTLAIPPVAFWFHFGQPADYERRDLGINVHHGAIWWELWVDFNDSYRGWRRGNWDFVSWILGSVYFQSDENEIGEVIYDVVLEKTYIVSVKIHTDTWTRTGRLGRLFKWFTTKIAKRATLKCEEGIPFPDKKYGGEDRLYEMTMVADSEEDALDHFIDTIHKYRGVKCEQTEMD